MNKCCKTGCHADGTERRNNAWYCPMHTRVRQMRIACRHDNKTCPDESIVDDLVKRIIQSGMECELCGVRMNWMKKDGISSCVSLQHDRSGSFRLICLGCNVRHGQLPGDKYYEIRDGQKWCAGCETVLDASEFYPSRTIAQGVMSRCKKCSAKIARGWAKNNRTRATEYERERRKRKAEESRK